MLAHVINFNNALRKEIQCILNAVVGLVDDFLKKILRSTLKLINVTVTILGGSGWDVGVLSRLTATVGR